MAFLDDLAADIAAARAALETPEKQTLQVVLARKLRTIEFTKLRPDEWQLLTSMHSPRPGVDRDKNLGANYDALPRDYPASQVTIDGETVDQQTWQDVFGLLDSVHRNNVATVLWGLNVYNAIKQLQDLGKAVAGQSNDSPAKSGARRAGSTAASPRKSRGTTTTRKAG